MGELAEGAGLDAVDDLVDLDDELPESTDPHAEIARAVEGTPECTCTSGPVCPITS